MAFTETSQADTRAAAGLKITIIGLGIATLAACATPAPLPPPPPPPPQPVEVIPARPTPPGGASLNMTVPPMGIDGRRVTVNTGISATQQLWNMRSGLNVAALNCRSTRHIGLVENYGTFLTTHKRELATANDALAREYRAKHGRREGRNIQDSYQTKVYNYFALPPALPAFCDEALAVSRDLVAVPRGELTGFVTTALPRMEGVFGRFYNSYEQYFVDVAAWDARYGYGAGSGAGNAATSATNFGPGVGAGNSASGAVPQPIETVSVPASQAAPTQAAPSSAAPGFSLTPNSATVAAPTAMPTTAPAASPANAPVFVSRPVVQPESASGDQ